MCHAMTGAGKVVVVIWTNSLRDIVLLQESFSVSEPIFITQWNLLSTQFDIE